jgi:hypothetical protein
MPSRVIEYARRGRDNQRREPRRLPRTSARHRLQPATTTTCPIHPGDAAQAGVFEGLLRAEMAELRHMATVMTPRLSAANAAGQLPNNLVELIVRMEEVNRLLAALRSRFHPQLSDDEPAVPAGSAANPVRRPAH